MKTLLERTVKGYMVQETFEGQVHSRVHTFDNELYDETNYDFYTKRQRDLFLTNCFNKRFGNNVLKQTVTKQPD